MVWVFSVPVLEVLEPAKVVCNQMKTITPRTTDDHDALLIRLLREEFRRSGTADLAGEDDTALLNFV